jgi:4-alpha-glucanotransferase
MAVAPIQDLLDLGTEARMNFPGKPEGNWEWRLGGADLGPSLGATLRELNIECGRLHRGRADSPSNPELGLDEHSSV